MVYDVTVKDQDQETAAASTTSATSVVAEASPAPVVVVVSARPSARPPRDKRLGVRHPLKHRLFRTWGKMMVEPGGAPPAHVDEEEEGGSEVEEEELVEAKAKAKASSVETAMWGTEVDVSSSPAAGVQEMDTEVEGGEMEVSPEQGSCGEGAVSAADTGHASYSDLSLSPATHSLRLSNLLLAILAAIARRTPPIPLRISDLFFIVVACIVVPHFAIMPMVSLYICHISSSPHLFFYIHPYVSSSV